MLFENPGAVALLFENPGAVALLEFCERSEQNSSIYIKIQSVCLSVCSCLFAGLTAARINLIFGMHTLIWSDCAIGYIILTFEVIKGHFRSNKFLWQVP